MTTPALPIKTIARPIPSIRALALDNQNLTDAFEDACGLLDDPSDNFYVVAIMPVFAPWDENVVTEMFCCHPFRYYDICPGAHKDMPALTFDTIEELIGSRPVVLITRDRIICS